MSNVVPCVQVVITVEETHSICAVNTVPVLLLVTIENIVYYYFLFVFVLLHVLTHDLLPILISVMLCYATQCLKKINAMLI